MTDPAPPRNPIRAGLDMLNDWIGHQRRYPGRIARVVPDARTLAAEAAAGSKAAMKVNCPGAVTAPAPPLVPSVLAAWLSILRPCFTTPVWRHVLILVTGAVLAPGKRAVTQGLRVMGAQR